MNSLVRTFIFWLLTSGFWLLAPAASFSEDLRLQDLIDEALKNNHELMFSELKVSASRYRIPQAESLPDPMFMFGYQNEGFRQIYNFSDSADSQWMFSASQMFPYPGKLALKGEMALRDSEGMSAQYHASRLAVTAKVKELYYDLFLTYKDIELLKDRAGLFSRLEDAALTRYSTGMAAQQEVLMAQTEKYMLLEKEEMLKQKQQSIEAMLNITLGRDVSSMLGRPPEPVYAPYGRDMGGLINAAYDNSPEVKSKEQMIASAETRVQMAKKEFYPDFTVSANYFARNAEFPDMWSLTTTINIPLFYRTKQKMALLEAESGLSQARHELEAVKSMLSSGIRDNLSMVRTAERLMDIYKDALVPRAYQDFESALSAFVTGKAEALTAITRLKSLIDYELLYWRQFVEREKAIARLEAITGSSGQEGK